VYFVFYYSLSFLLRVYSFGESFYMLENGESHDYMKIVQNFAQASALIGTIPWIVSFFPWLPKLEGVEKLFRFTKERVTARIPLGDIPTDIFSYLLREDRVTKRKYTQMELNRECVSLVIGGGQFLPLLQKIPYA